MSGSPAGQGHLGPVTPMLPVIWVPRALLGFLSSQGFTSLLAGHDKRPSKEDSTAVYKYLASCPGVMVKCPHFQSAGACSVSFQHSWGFVGCQLRRKDFWNFLVCCLVFLLFWRWRKRVASNFLYFTWYFKGEGASRVRKQGWRWEGAVFPC